MGAVVAALTPSRGTFDRVERVGRVWIAWLARQALGRFRLGSRAGSTRVRDHGRARILVDAPSRPIRLTVRETWDPGWTALLDGKPAEIQPKSTVFLNIEIPVRSA